MKAFACKMSFASKHKDNIQFGKVTFDRIEVANGDRTGTKNKGTKKAKAEARKTEEGYDSENQTYSRVVRGYSTRFGWGSEYCKAADTF